MLLWKVAFKNAKVKLDCLADIDMFLMVKKGISHAIHLYTKIMTNT